MIVEHPVVLGDLYCSSAHLWSHEFLKDVSVICSMNKRDLESMSRIYDKPVDMTWTEYIYIHWISCKCVWFDKLNTWGINVMFLGKIESSRILLLFLCVSCIHWNKMSFLQHHGVTHKISSQDDLKYKCILRWCCGFWYFIVCKSAKIKPSILSCYYLTLRASRVACVCMKELGAEHHVFTWVCVDKEMVIEYINKIILFWMNRGFSSVKIGLWHHLPKPYVWSWISTHPISI